MAILLYTSTERSVWSLKQSGFKKYYSLSDHLEHSYDTIRVTVLRPMHQIFLISLNTLIIMALKGKWTL